MGCGNSPDDRGETVGLAEFELRARTRVCGRAGARRAEPLPAPLHLQGRRGRENLALVHFLKERGSQRRDWK